MRCSLHDRLIRNGATAPLWSSGKQPESSSRRVDGCNSYTYFWELTVHSAATCWILHMLRAWGHRTVLILWISSTLLCPYSEPGPQLWRCLMRSLRGACRQQQGVVHLQYWSMQVTLALSFVLQRTTTRDAWCLICCVVCGVWCLKSRMHDLMAYRRRLAALEAWLRCCRVDPLLRSLFTGIRRDMNCWRAREREALKGWGLIEQVPSALQTPRSS